MGRAATAIGMMATSELALALRSGVSVQNTCRGTNTKPPPTPSRPPRRRRRGGGGDRLFGRAGRGLGRARHHRVVPELRVRGHLGAGLLRLLLLFGLAS